MDIVKHKRNKYTITTRKDNKNYHNSILQLFIINYLLYCICSYKFKPESNYKSKYESESNLIVEIYIAWLSFKIKNQNKLIPIITRKMRNRMMHYLNGNKKIQKPKKHLKIFQLNKGSSFIDTNKTIVRDNIVKSMADIAVLGEAQVGRESNTLTTDYPDYNLELKFMDGAVKSRIAVLVKKGITYERLSGSEFNDVSMVVLKVKMSRGKSLIVVSVYRQWQLPPEMRTDPSKCGPAAQLDRWSRIMNSINNLNHKNDPMVVIGDLNIDQWATNDPLSRPDLKQLNDMLESTKLACNLEQMNHKPTRFSAGQNPSLLDLFLANIPQNINCISTYNSNIADHLCVSMQVHIKELSFKQQFLKIRD